MEITARRLAPQEIDHELVWLLVSLGTFAGLALWRWARLAMPRCVFHSLTGLPCVTCGATRSAWQFLHGHFLASFLFNPLAFLACCGITLFDFYAAVIVLTSAPRFRLEKFSVPEKAILRGLAVFLIAANWLYLITAGSV